MRLLTAEQSLKLDQLMQSQKNVSAEHLMRQASYLFVKKFIKLSNLKRDDRVLVVCGSGNNGGDGLCIAKLLVEHAHVEVVHLTSKSQSDLNKKMKEELLNSIHPNQLHSSLHEVQKDTKHIIDAIFGVGLKRHLEKEYIEIIQKINSSQAQVWAVDVPSGLDPNTGTPKPVAIRAHQTFTVSRPKPGFFLREGVSHRGQIRIIPLFENDLLKEFADTHFLFTHRHAVNNMQARRIDGNKFSFGKSAIVAGDEGMWGAARLSSEACLRIGCGYVCWFPFKKNASILEPLPEVLVKTLDLNDLNDYAWLLGPGLKPDDKLKKLIKELIKKKVARVVLDAGALTALSKFKITKLPATWILTPHSGELSRLIGKSSKKIDEDPVNAAHLAHKKFGCIVLLKGLHSVAAYKNKFIIVNSGNVALAKAGTGDVLAGFIVGLLAQGYDPLKALLLASYIHGYIADLWVKKGNDPASFMASDLLKYISKTLMYLRKSKNETHSA